MDMPVNVTPTDIEWPEAGVSRVPFRLFSDPAIYAAEQKRFFRGPIWNFLCLEIEVPNPGDWRLAVVGEIPVVVTRDENGDVHALVNRCAHKGALVCLQQRGNAKALTCVYHSWSYDLSGQLQSVAFRHGLRGKGGMPEDFDVSRAPAGEAAGGDVLRPGVRHLLRSHAAGGGLPRRDHGAHDPPQPRPPLQAARHAQPGDPQQLEAVRRERARFVSRHAAAHLLHHVQGEPPGHGWRHAVVRQRLAQHQLRQARHAAGGGGIRHRPLGAVRIGAGGPAAAGFLHRVRRRHHALHPDDVSRRWRCRTR